VTHALDTVIRYCTRGIVIDNGHKVFDGSSKNAVDTFKKVLSGNFYEVEKSTETTDNKTTDEQTHLKEFFERHVELDTYGNGKATIIDYGILDQKDKPSVILNYNSKFKIIMKVKVFEDIKDPIFAFTLKDSKGLEITGTNSMMKHLITGICKDGEILTVTFSQKANLQLGSYALSLGCVSINEKGIEVYNRIYDAILFEVIGAEQMVGFFDLESEVSIEK
jgi:teichoic acid transport system ATP-binding protein